jgi:hypothetical protein
LIIIEDFDLSYTKTHKVLKRDLQRMLSLNWEAGVDDEMSWFSSIMKD